MLQNSQNRKNLWVDSLIGHVFGIVFVFLISNLFVAGSYSVSLNHRQFGADVQTDGMGGYVSDVPGTEGMSEMDVVSTLRHDIQLLDEEIMKCERKRKGWVAATVVGGVGVVGTGIGALVQNSKIQDKKSELQRVQSDVETTKQSVQDAEKRLQGMQ